MNKIDSNDPLLTIASLYKQLIDSYKLLEEAAGMIEQMEGWQADVILDKIKKLNG
jgi:hypothetical protein